MFATVFYWIIIAATGLWGIWSAAWSIIYVAKHENGNLWIFAIINVLILALRSEEHTSELQSLV